MDRFRAGLSQIVGRRITYAELTGKRANRQPADPLAYIIRSEELHATFDEREVEQSSTFSPGTRFWDKAALVHQAERSV